MKDVYSIERSCKGVAEAEVGIDAKAKTNHWRVKPLSASSPFIYLGSADASGCSGRLAQLKRSCTC
jgi:hypothetical protein